MIRRRPPAAAKRGRPGVVDNVEQHRHAGQRVGERIRCAGRHGGHCERDIRGGRGDLTDGPADCGHFEPETAGQIHHPGGALGPATGQQHRSAGACVRPVRPAPPPPSRPRPIPATGRPSVLRRPEGLAEHRPRPCSRRTSRCSDEPACWRPRAGQPDPIARSQRQPRPPCPAWSPRSPSTPARPARRCRAAPGRHTRSARRTNPGPPPRSPRGASPAKASAPPGIRAPPAGAAPDPDQPKTPFFRASATHAACSASVIEKHEFPLRSTATKYSQPPSAGLTAASNAALPGDEMGVGGRPLCM